MASEERSPAAETTPGLEWRYAVCPKCRIRIMTEDRAPDGTLSRFCWNADCRHQSVLTPVLVGMGSVEWRTEAEVEEELEQLCLEVEAHLQSLTPENLDPAAELAYWSSEDVGTDWREEFAECREHYETTGDGPKRSVQLAAAVVHRLRSVHRAGRVERPAI